MYKRTKNKINIANVLREAGSRFQASGPAGTMIRPWSA